MLRRGRRMDRSSLFLVFSLLTTSGCTVIADVDYRRGDGNAAGDFVFSGPLYVAQLFNADPSAAYASALDVELNVLAQTTLVFRTNVDSWSVGPLGLCESGSLRAADSENTDLQPRLEQVVGGTGELCVVEQEGGGDWLVLQQTQAGSVPSEQEHFLPGDGYSFELTMQGPIADVFDGSKPELTNLPELTGGSFEFAHRVYQEVPLLTSISGTFEASIEVLR
jgi:hypothetical protein